jgi:ABC-type oligopeptide transport system substrate-binding subunit
MSGPVAGVIGSRHLGDVKGIDNLITFDTGGTSSDMAVLPGPPLFKSEVTVARHPLRTHTVDIESTTLEPPLGSGPYRIREFTPGRGIVYERVDDYWGHAINVNIGRNNFDELRFAYFRDGAAGPGGTQSRRNRLAH